MSEGAVLNQAAVLNYVEDASIDPKEHAHWKDGSNLIRAKEIPWTPWAMPHTYFKLLDFDRNFSHLVFLLRIDAEAPAIVHKHIGAANAYIIEGGFSYDHGAVYEGDFMCEAGGVTHTPQVHENGCTMLAFGHSVVAGFNPDNSVSGFIDVDWMVDRAKENGAFGHLAWKDLA